MTPRNPISHERPEREYTLLSDTTVMTTTSQSKNSALRVGVPGDPKTPLTAADTLVEHGEVATGWQGKPRRWMPPPDDLDNHPNRTLVLCFDGTGDQFDVRYCYSRALHYLTVH